MLQSNQKTSLLVPYQLPEFVGDNPDYENFVAFLQAYYEWLETPDAANSMISTASAGGQGVTYGTKNILNYIDVDRTTNDFLDYFVNNFLPFFPNDALISKDKAIKVARQLYESKGTPASYQFLFRILYNSDFSFYKTGDATLRASSGAWYVAISLKLATADKRFLKVTNAIGAYRVFGETSKSFAVIENVVLVGNKIQVFISNIERLFESGEYVRIVDTNNQDVIVDGQNLRSKIVGQISQINLARNPNGTLSNRGTLYEVGDPVIVYNGLNPDVYNPIGATAEVGSVTSGAITTVRVDAGGYGYSNFPNTFIDIQNGPGANVVVYSLNPDPSQEANVVLFSTDSIAGKEFVPIGNTRYNFFANPTANANTSIANALNFISFSTYPISSVSVVNGGGGIDVVPQLTAYTTQQTDIGTSSYLDRLGILAPIKIVDGGIGYHANDTITFNGGSGYGAYANVTSVSNTGSITGVSYVFKNNEFPHHYPLGGMGYKNTALPTLGVMTSNVGAVGAVLTVPGVLGTGALFSVATQQIGSVTTINLTSNGEDYVSTPNVSLSVQDILVSNADILMLPQNGDFIYQGISANSTSYQAFVYSTKLLIGNLNTFQSLYSIRVFNYNSTPNPNLPLIINGKNIYLKMANTAYNQNHFYLGSPAYNVNGIKNYGDGNAKATASFLNGLVHSAGQYLNTKGQPSSYDVIQSLDYNDFTYQITVSKEIAKYRDILLNLLHGAGTKLLGRYELTNHKVFNFNAVEALYGSKSLQAYTGASSSNVTITTDFVNHSNNIVMFNNLSGANIATFIFSNVSGKANSVLQIISENGPNVRSEVYGVDYTSNTVTLKEQVVLTYPNVAYSQATTNTNIINITQLTYAYNIVNNGVYSNPMYPLMDIVYAGDIVQIANGSYSNTYTVSSVDYVNQIIYTTTNITSNANNSLLSVNRTFGTQAVTIIGPVGLEYVPEIITESGMSITTEDGYTLILD